MIRQSLSNVTVPLFETKEFFFTSNVVARVCEEYVATKQLKFLKFVLWTLRWTGTFISVLNIEFSPIPRPASVFLF